MGKPGFGSFTAPEASVVDCLPRSRYAGKTPAEAAALIVEDYHAMRPLKASTRRQKQVEFRKILLDLGERGLDMASVDTRTLTEYRAYLQKLVTDQVIDEDYAYNLVKDWNAMVNLLFGEKDNRPGTGLKMKGFRQSPKIVDHLDMADIDAMIARLDERHWMNPLNKGAVHTFLELSIASAGRWSSIGAENCTFGDIDWNEGTILFQAVKNKAQHRAVLTPRALARLAQWRRELKAAGAWQGEGTPIMTAGRGLMTYNSVRVALHDLAGLAGLHKVVTTHVARKSVGTHMAKDNPRMAREQLGVTEKVFQLHYNQPTVKDRLERRDLLMGAEDPNRSPESRIGALFLRLQKGQISQQEFDRELNRGLLGQATKGQPKDTDLAYG